MGIETSPDHGGAGSSFTSAIIVIEELAKIDPSVSVLCDVHNTLVNTVFRTYGTQEQKDKWLPLLAEKSVSSFDGCDISIDSCVSSVVFVYLSLPRVPMHSHYKPVPGRKATTTFSMALRCGSQTQTKLIFS